MLKKGTKTVMQYWVSDGNDWPVLQQVALRVFSMACSTVASERNFSTFVSYTKLRNSLTEDNVRKLVYIKTNALQLSDQPPQIDDDNSGQEEEDDIVI
ncbi:hypothetical protein BSLG_010358 [Batrachochytrium salamandrivorans]|nr:hypothetical protein BSLG_010358 [Batrachochytrium salamandrivorans]